MAYKILSAVVAFVISFVLLKIFIPILRKVKLGQKILEIGPSWHKCKEGTPTMGGLFFSLAVTVSSLVFAAISPDGISKRMIYLTVFALMSGLVGFIDDYIKLFKKTNKGLSAAAKLILQLFTVGAFLLSLKLTGDLTTVINIPFTDKSFDMGIFYYIVMLPMLAYFINGANLTDGIDGLAGSVALVICVFTAAVSEIKEPSFTYISYAAVGALFAFLAFNFHPAKIFMGDTGSLYLGGLICGFVVMFKAEILIFLICFVWLVEGISVMLQVAYFKHTGKRLFKMAPLHHHFEMSGWSEVKIVAVFSLVTALSCGLAFFIYTF